ncbi:Concanavalin A-like lectin/glucanase, subgroup, partial [Cynara cardunculus var. scolymus]
MGSRIRLWMLIVCSQVMVIAGLTNPNDVAVLNAIKSSWQNIPPNWSGPDPCGSNWEGINCTDSHVTSLNLAGIGVSTNNIGDIPSLSKLQYLDLSNNKGITAVLPESIQDLKNLTTLALNNNSFIGFIPPSIGNLTNLSWLDLSDNQLHGSIPVSNRTAPLGLDKLVKARHFIMNNNELSGTIPSSIGLVVTLEAVRLDSNSLSGIVPRNLTNLRSVGELYLSNNKLNGSVPNLTGMNSLFYVLMDKTQLQGEIPSNVFQRQLERLVLSNNALNGTLDVGNSYSSDLIVDLTNNSIANFTQNSVYNMSLNLVNNPVCEEGRPKGRYCGAGKPNIPNGYPSNSCTPVRCSSNKLLSPNCNCSHPYTGTIHFFSHSFSDLDNTTYYTILHDVLISAFRSNQLPVDSISISNAIVDEFSYLQYRLNIFPSDQDYFTRSEVSSIGTVLNRQTFILPLFGPLFFLDENYCCFPGEKKSSNTGIIIGATVGGFLLLLLLVMAVIYAIYQKRLATRAKQNSPFASWGLDNGSDVGGVPQLKGARWCSFEELKKSTDNFSEGNIIGSGGYGKVYKGTLNTGHVVAIKRAQQGSLQGAHEFKTEIELLSRIHHKNVVALVGFCYDQGEQMLVYEYISNGTLKDNLSGKSRIRLNWMKRLRLALDSAKGLTYLHELANPPIIHRDIKSTNILLDDHLNAKVADFGLSKLLGDESKGYVSTQVKGTLAINRSGDPSGLSEILDPSLGSSQTLGGLTKFVNLAMSCVQDAGVDRPKMGEVVREIESIIDLAALSLDPDSSSTFSTQNTGNVVDLYHPYGDSISDESSLYVPFETDLR